MKFCDLDSSIELARAGLAWRLDQGRGSNVFTSGLGSGRGSGFQNWAGSV